MLFQITLKEGPSYNITREGVEEEAQKIIENSGIKDGVVNVSHFLKIGDKLVLGKNVMTLKFTNIPEGKLDEVALKVVNKINEMLKDSNYKVEVNMLIFKPLVPSDKNSNVKAYLSLNVDEKS